MDERRYYLKDNPRTPKEEVLNAKKAKYNVIFLTSKHLF